mmetsp:Transcript_50035/g.88179  ORF Transcript_50035/g.88179 Transcript_50035/m.88179 type:complete len:274 (-) Transcript_50035:81-902(-)
MAYGAANSRAFKAKARRPGPGSHDIPAFPEKVPTSTMPTAPGYSIAQGAGLEEPVKKRDKVGPGAYHPRRTVTEKAAPGYGFGRARRVLSETRSERHRNDPGTPAPQMEQKDNQNYVHAPKYSFGSEEKFFRCPGIWSDLPGRGSKMPGPGEHNPDDRITSRPDMKINGPSWSATPRRGGVETKLSSRSFTPGPGAYRPEDAAPTSEVKVTPRYKFGTAARLAGVEVDKKAPGPGQYSTTNTTRTGHSSVGGSAPKWSMPGRQELDLMGGMGT